MTLPLASIESEKPALRAGAVMPETAMQKLLPNGMLANAALIFTPLALAAMLVFYVLYSTQLAATQKVIASGQTQLVEVGLTTLNSTLSTLDNDAKFISDQPLLHKWLMTNDPEERQLLLGQFLSFVRHRGLYDQVRMIGMDGKEILRVNWNRGQPVVVPDSQLQNKGDRYYFRQSLGLQDGQSYFSPFDLNIEGGAIEQPIKPTIRVGAPVIGVDGNLHGVVVLNYLGQRALDRVRKLSTQGMGEAWLIDAHGYWLLGPTPEDEWSFMYDNGNRSFAHDFPTAWTQIAASAQAGQFTTNGDLFTFAPVSPPEGSMTGQDMLVPSSAAPSWFLVTRSPAQTYSQGSQQMVMQYFSSLACVLLVLGGISWMIAHHSTRRRAAERQVFSLNQRLERDNVALENVNRELESFSYSVSHDLRAPLRSIDGFSKALLEDYGDTLDAQGQDYLGRVRNAAQRMGNLIDDLITLARVTRSELGNETVDLSLLARRVGVELRQANPDRQVDFTAAPDLMVRGDGRLLRIVFDNLIGNAWKFTSKQSAAKIEFSSREKDGETIYLVSDNGAGFDMAHANKLFGVFQRLHAVTEFEGTGIGLATVQRIIYKHGGRVWAEAEKDRGATFFFTLRAGADDNETNIASRG